MRQVKRAICFSAGFITLTLGVAGIFLPLLPTTPFLIASAYLFARSSERMRGWIHRNRLLGRYIRDYMEGRGIPRRAKIWTISVLWATMALTAFMLADLLAGILLALIGIAVSAHIITR